MWLRYITIPIYGREAGWRILRWGLWSECWLQGMLQGLSRGVGQPAATWDPSLGNSSSARAWGGSAMGEWEGARDPVLASESRRGAEQTMRRQRSCNWIWCGPASCCDGDNPKAALEQFRALHQAPSLMPLSWALAQNSECGVVNTKWVWSQAKN